MRTAWKGLLTAGIAIVFAGTMAGSAGARQKPWSPPELSVNNIRDVPVVVYLDRGNFETRLGTVEAHQKVKLPLPPYVEDGDQIDVIVHPEGGVDLASGNMTVHFGKELYVWVPDNNVGYVPPPPPRTIPNPGAGITTVTVENDRSVPVTVYVEHGNFGTRIGTVPANEELTLLIPEMIVREQTEAEIFVHPEGEADLASWTFQLRHGAHLFVKVPVY